MATKAELRDSYIANGWEIQPVENWALVVNAQVPNGSVLYDVNYVNPDQSRFGTAQVVVVDDGGAGETATAFKGGALADPDATFAADVRAYAQGLEGSNRFAIPVTQIWDADEVALATVYKTDGTSEGYVIKRRAGTFSFQALI